MKQQTGAAKSKEREPERDSGPERTYCAPAILWEQEFVALMQTSCVPASDPLCTGATLGPPDPRE